LLIEAGRWEMEVGRSSLQELEDGSSIEKLEEGR
jgi:hypothetical protein